ncbi:hypothetical protein [Streptomyces sp. NPDC021608]|uniref:hypothetical protein n=1 Tax=Streptomyces sp. NPDC021608 TaxID=3154903 RepID=UPI0033DBD5C8
MSTRRTRRLADGKPSPGTNPLWREAYRRAVLALAAASGPVAVALAKWLTERH